MLENEDDDIDISPMRLISEEEIEMREEGEIDESEIDL
jgi:hypothetical protein